MARMMRIISFILSILFQGSLTRILFLYQVWSIIQPKGGVRSVTVIVKGDVCGARVQILDVTVCISHSAYILWKAMHSTIPLPAMGKKKGKLSPLTLIWQPVKEKQNSEYKLVKFYLKIEHMSHHAGARGWVNTWFSTPWWTCTILLLDKYVLFYSLINMYLSTPR